MIAWNDIMIVCHDVMTASAPAQAYARATRGMLM